MFRVDAPLSVALLAAALACATLGCATQTPDSSAFAQDLGAADTGPDAAGATDGVELDAAGPDTAGPDTADTHTVDTPNADATVDDAEPSDSAPSDTGAPDTSTSDTSTSDTSTSDTGAPDTGAPDTGAPDTGAPDTTGCLKPVDCDDGKVCTVDLCNPSDGTCSHKPHTGACDDGDPCTLDDTCSGGACKGGPPRYVRREIAAKTAVGGGAVARSQGKVALAARAESRPFVYGLDTAGLVNWKATPAGATNEGGFHALVAHSAGSFVAGGWRTLNTGGTAPYFAHIGATGTVIKTGTLAPVSVQGEVRGMVPSAQGNLVHFAGSIHDGKGSWEALYGRYDVTQGKASGNLSYVGGAGVSKAAYGVTAAGSKNILFGWTGQKGGNPDGWLYAADVATGFKSFEVVFGNKSSNEGFFDAAIMADAGILAVGYTSWNKSTSTKLNVWLVRTDKLGKELWIRQFGTDANDYAAGVLPHAGGALLVGATASVSAVQGLGALWQVDPWGNMVWQRTHNLSGNERLESVLASPEGVLVAGTQTSSSQAKLVFMRSDAFGHATCSQSGVCAGKSGCDDGDVCTGDDCDAGKGCVQTPLTMGAPCGVGLTCTAQAKCK